MSAVAPKGDLSDAPVTREHVLMLLGNNPYPEDGRVRREAVALRRHGFAVTVVCPRDDGQISQENVDGVEVVRYRPRSSAGGAVGFVVEHVWAAVASLVLSMRIGRRHPFAVVHVHNPPDLLIVPALLHKLLGRRVIFDHHDLSPEMYEARFGTRASRSVYRALLMLERRCCRGADRVIATNDSYASLDVTRHGVDPSKVTVVRNGPELDRLRRVAPDDSLRDGSSLVLCFAGTIGPQDGVDHLIRAVHHLIHDEGRDDVRCFVVGDGDAVADLRQLARDLGVDGRVEFVGHQRHDELVRYICSADVCVEPAPSNPYNDRSTMIKVMEYLALGATVVAFDLPEHRVSAGECAVYVTPNDSAALAKAIAAIADDSGQRQSLSIQGHARARDHLAWDHNAVRLIEAYRLVLGPVR